ncbi:MAG: AAA domain-containing protein [Anaeroplasma bactoclasticum]|nr:AAA domain-containing protein [Anaeroplasma bactoclasticum]
MTPEETRLYTELFELREKMKEDTRRTEGRASLVCTDDALEEIVKLRPKKLEDFEGIKGIGKTFIENYGQAFLKVISKYQSSTEKRIVMSSQVAHTMKELEKKLVNINKRNRLLSLNHLASKYAFDLFVIKEQRLEKILFSASKVNICNLDHPIHSVSFNEELSKYKKLVTLLREANKDLREKGQNDLYIGYPFVIGRLPGENFDVHAPLILFPVLAERTPSVVSLQIDESRDVIYNHTLLLAYYKFNQIQDALPNDEVEVTSKESLITQALQFYKDKGLYIQGNDVPFSAFKEYKLDTFPSFVNGELHLEMSAVLGKFPVCSSSIQRDFDQMIEENTCNTLVEQLLQDKNIDDFDIDRSIDIVEENIVDKDLVISERHLLYINELNSSQEAVLQAIEKQDAIVVQGPPGTGKSQTIASLIAHYVGRGKTILMVSEKKTALDVVYSRLGALSSYALFIDDVENKQSFYRQLAHILDLAHHHNVIDMDVESLSDQIDSQVKTLENIATTLYTPSAFGIEPYRLYLLSRKYDFNQSNDYQLYKCIKEAWQDKLNLLQAKYAEIETIKTRFSHQDNLEKIIAYIRISKTYPFLQQMKPNLTEFEVSECKEMLQHLQSSIISWKEKNYIVKLFTKGKIKKEINTIISQYFTAYYPELSKLLFNAINPVIEGMTHYASYQEYRFLFDHLNELEKEYTMTIFEINSKMLFNLEKTQQELWNALLFRQIEMFETAHRAVLGDIQNFDDIIRNISQAISRKQQLTKVKLEHLLLMHVQELSASKRQGEIRRVIESKRKWSVNRFIQKFGFELFKSIHIWLLTPEVVSEIIPFETGIFDLVIFDEASQMYIEKGIPTILRGKKVVIAGDQKQLRPSSLGFGRTEIDSDELAEDEEVEAALEEESLLDLARFQYCDVLLNFHYRSKYEELIAFSNAAFYHGRLYVAPNAINPDTPPIEVHHLADGMWQNRSNRAEAKYIVGLLKNFFKSRKNGETIGIITFNSNQRDLIDDLIDEECATDLEFRTQILAEQQRKKDGEDIGLFVKNIETVQGDERDVIIFSIGYAKNENGRVVTRFGWLNQKGGENRLNVAITRAKTKIHIVTSIVPQDLVVEATKNDGPRYFKKYLEYAYAISDGDQERAKQVLLSFGDETNPGTSIQFDSDFENQVYDALVEKGYTVDTQIGIGGYRIDLAIKKDGKYILGIECDGKLYHSSKSARERDIHRQKYLESRGWRIHRIWSKNWWDNPNQEIAKIESLVHFISVEQEHKSEENAECSNYLHSNITIDDAK